ncbi:MAG: response regulator [Gammaproteobacteria bacterium]|nr:MAG: response regulator [Gammaproteobacteria bacterium]
MPDTVQPHILVVDDDPQIRELLEDYLAENELRVSVAATGAQMSQILADQAIDLVVLDLRLAGEDGMMIARTLRTESAIPIVMLTGVRDEADRVMGLELGADDYLTKPFSPRELLARIRTVLRRTKSSALTQARQREVRAYRFDGFQRVLTREQLLDASRVYDNEVYDRSIDVQVLRLRRKIEADPTEPQFILTERGAGYCFNCVVEVLY